MRLVFMGTPEFAVPSLEALIAAGHEVAGVFTQPDRPAGRGKQLRPSPVKLCALSHRLPVYQPEKVKDPQAVAALAELKPEAIIVVAYGQILPQAILQMPSNGCINVHASLLPAYRGAAPIQWAVINGETKTGITTMLMDQGLDTGDMLLKKEIPISPEATAGEIHDCLSRTGAELIVQTLDKLVVGGVKPVSQTGESTYAPLLKKEHEKLDWHQSNIKLHNQIRGLNPWPGAFALWRGEVLKIWQSKLDSEHNEMKDMPEGAIPGTIVEFKEDGFLVRTGAGFLLITQVQPAGKKVMSGRDFILGRHIQTGERLE